MHSRDPLELAKFEHKHNEINASANCDLIIDRPRGTNNPFGARYEAAPAVSRSNLRVRAKPDPPSGDVFVASRGRTSWGMPPRK
jgi:hypothetical protein